MELVEKYKYYRKRSKELNQKMIEKCITRRLLEEAGKYLGILRKDTLIFTYEEEVNVLMDFALHEIKTNGKNAVQNYKDMFGGEDDVEREILEAFISSYTSLFKIVDIFKEEFAILIKDVFANRKLKLMDIGFSQTASKNLLLFIRVTPFQEFNTTSGIAFVFEGELIGYLLHRYKIFMKKIKEGSESMKRFLCFYRLNKRFGIDVYYRGVK